jgi:hypothetical protein
MANGISISDRIRGILTSGGGLKEVLDDTWTLVEREYGIRVQFCRIFGKRWSYFSGPDDGDAVVASQRIELLPGWGIISDGQFDPREDWEKFLKEVASCLRNHLK